nr:thyroid adenoma-associated protein homolog [Parasteatoda tepidariorum]
MRSKKKTFDPIIYSFSDNFLATITNEDHKILFIGYLTELNSRDDAVQQINILKEIHKQLVSKENEENYHCYLNVLSYVFCRTSLKSSLKKALNRIFLDTYEQMPSAVLLALENNLRYSIQIQSAGKSIKLIEETTDCLLGILDNNFKLGPQVINNELMLVWRCISELVDYLQDSFSQISIEESHACQAVLKTVISIFQKCEKAEHLIRSACSYSQQIEKYLVHLLQNGETYLNCRLNAGIAYSYFLLNDPKATEAKNSSRLEFAFDKIKSYSQSSQLCIFSGIMAVVSSDEIMEQTCSQSPIYIILEEIISISKSVEDADLLLLSTRALIQWTNVFSNVLRKEKAGNNSTHELKKTFIENGYYVSILFKHVLDYREHYIDTLRHLTIDLFKNLLNLHLLSSDVDPCKSCLVKNWTLFLLNDLPEYNNGKYGLLGCIVNVVRTDTVIRWCPTLPEVLYKASKDSNLISHISDLLESLYQGYFGSEEDFQAIWLKPLIHHLCLDSSELVSAANDHILPKLFKVRPSSIHFLITELATVWEKNNGQCFSALITCIKLHQKEKKHRSVLEYISEKSLQKAFCHSDDQVRLSAFGLLCENVKTTEAVLPEDLELIKYSLPYNINCQSPSFRQQMVASLKKLFYRMKESRHSMERNIADKDNETSKCLLILEAYKEFIDWMMNFLYKSLHPGANFPRRVSSLNILFLIHSFFMESPLGKKTIVFSTLLFVLQDTYENNKQLALKVLSSSEFLNLMHDDTFLLSSLNAALILTSSTKPPDTVTAGYLFSLLVFSEGFKPVVLSHVSQQMKDGFCILPKTDLSLIEKEDSASLSTVILLSGELLKQFRIAQENLLDAAAHAPMYGALSCLKTILSQVNYRQILNIESSILWNSVLCEIVQLGVQIADVVEPVVCDSSPEGYLPVDINSESITQLQSTVRKALSSRFSTAIVQGGRLSKEVSDVELDIVKTHAVTAQILLLCCWRTHKEISLLFGEMCEKVPIKSENGTIGILGENEVAAIGNYFIRQMTLVKHRGAFEQAYVGFGKLCSTLWRCNVTSLRELPKIWLKDLLLAIKGQNETIQLCPTRRSAGLPFIIQAVLTSEPNLAHSAFFKETVSNFLNIALIKSESKIANEEIHALNILRALFRDACLSEALVPFASEALKIAITGFKSKSWGVRNASTLLFSSVLIRIFGVNRANDEAQKKNRLSGKTFFFYYKDTYSFLKKELENCASMLTQNPYSVSKVPTLYPVLLVLGKLYPTPGEVDPRLNSFIPFLEVCGGSAVWKIRVLVAKAMVSLISIENILPTLQSLFDSLPTHETFLYQQNKVHGILLQISYILRESSHGPENSTLLQTLRAFLSKYFHFALSSNSCYATKAAFLEIILHSMAIGLLLEIKEGQCIKESLLLDLQSAPASPDKDRYLSIAAVVTTFHSMLTEEHSDSKCNLFLNLLACSHESVKCTAIQLLIWFAENSLDEFLVEPVFLEGFPQSSIHFLMQKHKLRFQSILKQNELVVCLIDMLHNERKNSTCFGKLCQLLCSMPHAVELKWSFVQAEYSSDALNKLECLLSFFEECEREDIVDSLILLIGKTVICVSNLFLKKYESFSVMEMDEYSSILERSFQAFKKNAEPENSIPRRKLVAKILQDFCDESFFNQSKIFGNLALYLWETLLAILTDDEPEVKEIAAIIVVKIQTIYNNDNQVLPVVSTKALEEMLRIFLQLDIFSIQDYIGIFINWMLLYEKNVLDNMGDEHPFDRGELNVFAEELLLSQLASEQLANYLTTHSESLKNSTIKIDKITCWSPVGNNMTFDCAVTKCLSEIDAILENIHKRGAVFFLLDGYLGQDIIRICQHLYAIVSLVPWIKSKEALNCGISSVFSKIQDLKMNTYILDMLLLIIRNSLLQHSKS